LNHGERHLHRRKIPYQKKKDWKRRKHPLGGEEPLIRGPHLQEGGEELVLSLKGGGEGFLPRKDRYDVKKAAVESSRALWWSPGENKTTD